MQFTIIFFLLSKGYHNLTVIFVKVQIGFDLDTLSHTVIKE